MGRTPPPPPPTPCIIWAGPISRHGYGVNKGKAAHRVAYETAKGPIPAGLEIDHLCRVRNCVNPDHLEAVTHAENTLRGFGPCAVNARKTYCINGHEFTPENTYTRPNGDRDCRICVSARVMKYKRNRRSA